MPFAPQPLTLPAPRRVRFAKSPLALVTCQLRFEHLGAIDDERQRGLREALVDEYPVVQPTQGFQIQLGGPEAKAVTQQGWRFASIEQDWTVSVLPDSVSVETTAYTDWEDLDRRLGHVFAAVVEMFAPRVEIRLGLRYVNQFTRDDVFEPAGWAEYLRPELVALAAAPTLAPSAFNAQQVVQFDAGEDAILTMRHGVPGGLGEWPEHPFYLLDLDCFRERQRALDLGDVTAQASRFNVLITSLFQWCVTEALWTELDPHDK